MLLDVKENVYSVKILGFYIFRKIRVGKTNMLLTSLILKIQQWNL